MWNGWNRMSGVTVQYNNARAQLNNIFEDKRRNNGAVQNGYHKSRKVRR
jgi:hypothetical protein